MWETMTWRKPGCRIARHLSPLCEGAARKSALWVVCRYRAESISQCPEAQKRGSESMEMSVELATMIAADVLKGGHDETE